jgi:hypothetical protein
VEEVEGGRLEAEAVDKVGIERGSCSVVSLDSTGIALERAFHELY